MELTLQDIARIAPGLVTRVRQDIRQGRLNAERRMGVAGRPYVLTEQSLMQTDSDVYRELIERARHAMAGAAAPSWDMNAGSRGKVRMNAEPASMELNAGWGPREETWKPFLAMLEEENQLLCTVIDALTRELERQNERAERDLRQIQELSYKLGQAHQEIGRLERTGMSEPRRSLPDGDLA